MLHLFIPLLFAFSPSNESLNFTSIVIRTGIHATDVEQRVAELLRSRLSEPTGLQARIESETMPPHPATGEMVILLGIPANHDSISREMTAHRIKSLTTQDPGPEGFLLMILPGSNNPCLLAAGVDERGVLYAAGEILRHVEWKPTVCRISLPSDVRTAPAFMVRGTQFGQSGVAKRLGKVRDWTEEETQRVILDYALAGANVLAVEPGPFYDFIKSFGLMTQDGFGPNTGTGPPEWAAKESIGREGYLCPSVPEAHAALLEACDQHFRESPFFDFVRFHGGDGGGCECDKCDPYGKTFIHLVEEMAGIVHKYHPDSRVYITNQKFDNEDDNAIFEYLQEKPRTWLWGFCYGPGSDAMSWQPGHRQTHRMDLFRYPGFGPFGRYCQEILHQLPPQQVLLFYNEITHWRYSQHGYIQMYPRADRVGNQPPHWNHFIYERRPDQALTMVYDRLTFYAWPRYYHWVFNQLLRYGVGDMTHSSGSHDHFNQWMWQRLLWAPQTSVEDVVAEYCRTWFGEQAASSMAQAIFQMEEYLEEDPDTSITRKEGIDNYYNLVREGGMRIPAPLFSRNWLWREFMQKGAIDKYVKLRVEQQTIQRIRIERRIEEGFQTNDLTSAITEALLLIDSIKETSEMRQLREEAIRFGEESNALFGVRSEGIYNLDHDFIGLGWIKRQLERAQNAAGDQQRELLWRIIHYEDAGDGGYYDNCGTFNPAPNLVAGYPYDHGQPYVTGMLSEANRPSQRSMSFTQDESQGVSFHYRELDPQAQYRVCFTLVRPWYQERYASRMNQKSESIYADDLPLVKDLEIPEQMSDFYTFSIPKACVADGELAIRFQKAADVAAGSRVEREMWRNSGGWGTIVSEAWLMREDRLPWR